jgi:hypothetical protein
MSHDSARPEAINSLLWFEDVVKSGFCRNLTRQNSGGFSYVESSHPPPHPPPSQRRSSGIL